MKKILSFILLIFLFYPSLIFASDVKVQKKKEGWQMLLDDDPFFVKGVYYFPTAIGEDFENRESWMEKEFRGRNEYVHDAWLDMNKNNTPEDEERVGDFFILNSLGCNVIHLDHHVSADPYLQKVNSHFPFYNRKPNKKLMRSLFKDYGIRIAMGDVLGTHALGSGTHEAEQVTDYDDFSQRLNMLKSVGEMLNTHKNEPYLLMWTIGSGDNLIYKSGDKEKQESYAQFVNEVAKIIHQVDPSHPVCFVTRGEELLDVFAQQAKDIDILGVSYYPGHEGYTPLFVKVNALYDKPVLIMDVGVGPVQFFQNGFDEFSQKEMHQYAWLDIEHHRFGKIIPQNALGGFVYEYVDEWWYHGYPQGQNFLSTESDLKHEYMGLFSLGDGRGGAFQRVPRQIYGLYKDLWSE